MSLRKYLTEKNIIFLLAVIIFLIAIYQIKDITLLFFASFVLASAINPLVDKLNKRMPRGVALGIIYLVAFIIIGVLFLPFISILQSQIISLLKNLPQYTSQINTIADQWLDVGKKFVKIPELSQILSSVSGFSTEIINRSINITKNLLYGLTILFTLAMLVLYMLMDKAQLKRGYLNLFPPQLKDRAESIGISISKKVGGYVIGQILGMIAVGVLTVIGLAIIKVDYSILLGSLAGLLDIIPIIGPIIAIIPAIIIAAQGGVVKITIVIVVYSLAQWIVNTFIKPYIFAKFLDMHPLVIIFALFVSAQTLGVIGVILSPAIAAMACVLIDELYIKTINE